MSANASSEDEIRRQFAARIAGLSGDGARDEVALSSMLLEFFDREAAHRRETPELLAEDLNEGEDGGNDDVGDTPEESLVGRWIVLKSTEATHQITGSDAATWRYGPGGGQAARRDARRDPNGESWDAANGACWGLLEVGGWEESDAIDEAEK